MGDLASVSAEVRQALNRLGADEVGGEDAAIAACVV